jgi:hypothetical protein
MTSKPYVQFDFPILQINSIKTFIRVIIIWLKSRPSYLKRLLNSVNQSRIKNVGTPGLNNFKHISQFLNA